MKKVIDGKMYDTSTSEILYTEADTHRMLCRTQKGNYFKLYPNNIIKPISEDMAKEYIGEIDGDAYVEIWGEVEEA